MHSKHKKLTYYQKKKRKKKKKGLLELRTPWICQQNILLSSIYVLFFFISKYELLIDLIDFTLRGCKADKYINVASLMGK